MFKTLIKKEAITRECLVNILMPKYIFTQTDFLIEIKAAHFQTIYCSSWISLFHCISLIEGFICIALYMVDTAELHYLSNLLDINIQPLSMY